MGDPTMDDFVRGAFVDSRVHIDRPRFTEWRPSRREVSMARAEYQDWLKAHDAQVASEALREAADAYGSGQLTGMFMGRDDYAREWLRARANRLANGG